MLADKVCARRDWICLPWLCGGEISVVCCLLGQDRVFGGKYKTIHDRFPNRTGRLLRQVVARAEAASHPLATTCIVDARSSARVCLAAGLALHACRG